MEIKTKSIKYNVRVPYADKESVQGDIEVDNAGRAMIERAQDAVGRWLSVEQLKAVSRLYSEAARLAKGMAPKATRKKK